MRGSAELLYSLPILRLTAMGPRFFWGLQLKSVEAQSKR